MAPIDEHSHDISGEFGRISIGYDKVRNLAWFERTQLALDSKNLGCGQRDGTQCVRS